MITLFDSTILLVASIILFIIFYFTTSFLSKSFNKKENDKGSIGFKENATSITISVFAVLAIILLVFLSSPPIASSVTPQELVENLTFNNSSDANFTRAETIALHNFGRELEEINVNLDMTGCNASIYPNLKNREYVASGETIYLTFNLELSPRNLTCGIYRGSIQINATPVSTYPWEDFKIITINEIPIALKYIE